MWRTIWTPFPSFLRYNVCTVKHREEKKEGTITMLRTMVDYNVMFYVMGVVAAIGVCSKLVSQFALKRLVRASGNMNKSTHKLMKLMRAKYEHACMVSDKVQNVGAFVDKYVFEYRILGLRLHTWQQMQKQTMWMSALLGALSAWMHYYVYGMGEAIYRYAGSGAVLMMLLFLLHITTDEKYLLKSSKTYMIDYLENVCAHRYEKLYQKETALRSSCEREQLVSEEIQKNGEIFLCEPMADTKEESSKEEISPEAVQIQEALAKTTAEMNLQMETSDRVLTEEKERIEAEADAVPREAMIREILEEFLAQRT